MVGDVPSGTAGWHRPLRGAISSWQFYQLGAPRRWWNDRMLDAVLAYYGVGYWPCRWLQM
jgi:hypothetical protein